MNLIETKYKIGVIVPLFNKVNQINRALDSIFNQTVPFNEVIVVDDCSTDDSLKKVNIYKINNPTFPLKVIRHQYNKGPGAARNTGISILESDLFCFLDADDYFKKDFLENSNKNLEIEQNNLILIFKVMESSSNTIRPSLSSLKKFSTNLSLKVWEINNWEKAMILDSLFCSGGNVILSKKVIENIRFDEISRNFEDWDFYFRVCANAVLKKYPIKFVDIVGSVYSDDDIYSLSRARKISTSLLNPPILILNSDIPIGVRRFTYGIWLLHVSQRINLFSCFKLVFKIFRDDHDFKPNNRIIFISIISSLLGVKCWNFLSRIRKNLRYV